MERWKEIIGYEGLYEISDMGRVRIAKTKQLRKLNTCGEYPIILLRKKRQKQKAFKVHRLVAIHFIPNPENKPEVNHKYGNKFDPRATELEWSTPSENIKHAHLMGLRNQKGDNNNRCKI